MTMSVEEQDIKQLTDEEYSRVKHDYSSDSEVSLVLINMSFVYMCACYFLEKTLVWTPF